MTAPSQLQPETDQAATVGRTLLVVLRDVKSLTKTLAEDVLNEHADPPLRLGALLVLSRLQQGPARAVDLTAELGMDASVVSRHVAGLVRAKLLRRSLSDEDGRSTVLHITGAGTDLMRRLRFRSAERLRRALAGWPADDLDHLAAALTRLHADLHVQRQG